MTKHFLLTGVSFLAFGYKRSRNVGWYVNRRLNRPY